MKLEQHGTYLYRVAHYGLINCYLVVEDDGLSIIDTGIAGTAGVLGEAVKQLRQPLKRILLTHADGDHVGGLDTLHGRFPDAAVLIGAREARRLRGDLSLDPDEPQVKLKGSTGIRTQPTALLRDGDRIGSLQAVASPGHTPGHMAFFDLRDGSLIAGDAWVTQGGLAVAGQMRWRFPPPHLFTWHKPTALASARKLAELKPSRLAVGHGPVLERPAEAMRRVAETFSQHLEHAIRAA